jgi:small subunit ribosomal protein S3
MGNKINPIGIRIGINKDWDAKWYTPKASYGTMLQNDIKIREFIQKRLASAGVAKCVISRDSNKLLIEVNVVRQGIVIGKGGTGIQELTKELKRLAKTNVEVRVYEVKNPNANAKYIAEEIARQVASRIAPKLAANRMIDQAKTTGVVKGITVWVGGRIKGAEIARTEKFEWGSVPRHTLRADIDYHATEINVPAAGRHGIKVWVYLGERQFD